MQIDDTPPSADMISLNHLAVGLGLRAHSSAMSGLRQLLIHLEGLFDIKN